MGQTSAIESTAGRDVVRYAEVTAVELAPGTVIGGRYRLERLLGEGGMGAVWAAQDDARRRCAVKLMKDAGDPKACQRFLREGRAASAVRHPNVVNIYEVLAPDGEPPAIAMELLEGESLRAVLRREHRLSLAALVEIAVPVVSAMAAAHALGIVHRDLKPENIFLVGAAGERTVKVLDFGIAKLTVLDNEVMRSTGITTAAVLGTPAYMAPEQVFAESDLDHRADIWALGVTFYECLSGVCPTDGENVGQVLKHVVAKPFQPLIEHVPDLPEAISRLVARMLQRERAHRPADLGEVLGILAPFASEGAQEVRATLVTGGAPAVLAPSATPGSREVLAPLTAGGARQLATRFVTRRAMLRISAALVVLGVAATTWYSLSASSSSPSGAGPPRSCPAQMVRVPAGTFRMGSPDSDEHSQHEVTLSGYCIDRTEVTVAAYHACVEGGACAPAARTVHVGQSSPDGDVRWNRFCNGADRPTHPINCVDWSQAVAYCTSQGKRLPTEAEWEYAARGSDGRSYPWGNDMPTARRVNGCGAECVALDQHGLTREWTAAYSGDDGAPTTAPVGSYSEGASPFGALDMAGNVWEWTADWYARYTEAAAVNPHGPAMGRFRVARGGGWGVSWNGQKATVMRNKSAPTKRDIFLGFRCALGD
jgi:formylglycine-generating enzyme required for sulfatase activity